MNAHNYEPMGAAEEQKAWDEIAEMVKPDTPAIERKYRDDGSQYIVATLGEYLVAHYLDSGECVGFAWSRTRGDWMIDVVGLIPEDTWNILLRAVDAPSRYLRVAAVKK